MKNEKSVSYEKALHERLRDPAYAAEYLNAIFESAESETVTEIVFLAVNDILAAYSEKRFIF